MDATLDGQKVCLVANSAVPTTLPSHPAITSSKPLSTDPADPRGLLYGRVVMEGYVSEAPALSALPELASFKHCSPRGILPAQAYKSVAFIFETQTEHVDDFTWVTADPGPQASATPGAGSSNNAPAPVTNPGNQNSNPPSRPTAGGIPAAPVLSDEPPRATNGPGAVPNAAPPQGTNGPGGVSNGAPPQVTQAPTQIPLAPPRVTKIPAVVTVASGGLVIGTSTVRLSAGVTTTGVVVQGTSTLTYVYSGSGGTVVVGTKTLSVGGEDLTVTLTSTIAVDSPGGSTSTPSRTRIATSAGMGKASSLTLALVGCVVYGIFSIPVHLF